MMHVTLCPSPLVTKNLSFAPSYKIISTKPMHMLCVYYM